MRPSELGRREFDAFTTITQMVSAESIRDLVEIMG